MPQTYTPFFVKTSLDFQQSLAWNALSHQCLCAINPAFAGSIKEIMDTIFIDLPMIDRHDSYMVKAYLDSIEDALLTLRSLSLGFIFINEPRKNGTLPMQIGHYFLVPETGYICCGNNTIEPIHKVSSSCKQLGNALIEVFRREGQVQIWLNLEEVNRDFENTPNLCHECLGL